MTDTILVCPECGGPMALRRGRYGRFYACLKWPECRGTHGATPEGLPLGIPADSATKLARITAHEVFERMRLSRGMAKGQAYAWMANRLSMDGNDCHMSRFTLAQCEQVEELCRAWTKVDPDLPQRIKRVISRKNKVLMAAGRHDAEGKTGVSAPEFKRAGLYEASITLMKVRAGQSDWPINAISAMSCLMKSGDTRMLREFKNRLRHLDLRIENEGIFNA